MCQIIYKPNNATITKNELRQCWIENSDGAGFMFSENNKLIVQKGYMSFRSFWKAIKLNLNKTLVMHFRFSTHGPKNPDNTHPFLINESLAVCHNGIFSEMGKIKDGFSDTAHFVKNVLMQLPINFLDNIGIKCIIEEYCIKEHSKLVFMDHKSDVTILNEAAGQWQDGKWFSSYIDFDFPTFNSNFGFSDKTYNFKDKFIFPQEKICCVCEQSATKYNRLIDYGAGVYCEDCADYMCIR